MRNIPRAKLLIAVLLAGLGVVILVLLAIRVPRAIEDLRELAMVRNGTRQVGMKHSSTRPRTRTPGRLHWASPLLRERFPRMSIS
jgi:hypothetical protein